MVLKFGYWSIRGLLAPIEMLCEYTSQQYETTKYETVKKPDGSYDGSSWFAVKHTLGLTIPNIPWVMDSDENVAISESWAILKYIARKTQSTLPKSNADWGIAENLEGVLTDFRAGFIAICYYGADKSAWMDKNAVTKIDILEKQLAKRLSRKSSTCSSKVVNYNSFRAQFPIRDWFVGDYITYVDFYAWEIIDHHCCARPGFLDKHPNLKSWHTRFDNLTAVRKYHTSPTYRQYPINAVIACWGGQDENDGTL